MSEDTKENKPVMFTKAANLVPVRLGVYKNAMDDTVGFKLRIDKRCQRTRRNGYDVDYMAVVDNIGNSADDDAPQKLVFGFANVTVQEDGTAPFDWQGDIMKTEVLEGAAYNYVLNSGLANQEHEYGTECGWLVESIMFTKEKMAALGIPEGCVPEGWWVGFYIPDPDVYKKVIDGTYNMFSIEGYACRVPAEQ